MLNQRKERGKEIAARYKIKKKNGYWLVPSASSNKTYVVKIGFKAEQSCTCQDFQTRGQTCKHIYAVECIHA